MAEQGRAVSDAGGSPIDRVLNKLDSVKAKVDGLEQRMGGMAPPGAQPPGIPGEQPPIPPKTDDGNLTLQHEGQQLTHQGGAPGGGGAPPPPAAPKPPAPPAAAPPAAPPAAIGGAAPPCPPVGSGAPPPMMMDSAGKKADEIEDDEAKKDSKKPDAKKADDKKDDESSLSALRSKAKKDSKKADDDEGGKGEDEQEEEIARGDSIRVPKEQWNEMQAFMRSMQGREKRTDDERAQFAETQAYWDSVAQSFGKRAGAPLLGETKNEYDKRMATGFKQYSRWKDTKFSEVPDGAFEVMKADVYADAMRAAEHPVDLADGELRQVVHVDPMTGQRRIEWKGTSSFIKDFSRVGRRVQAFNRFPKHTAL
jgi:hypothetical protein